MKRTLNPILGVAAAAMMVAACETTAPSETTLDEAATALSASSASKRRTISWPTSSNALPSSARLRAASSLASPPSVIRLKKPVCVSTSMSPNHAFDDTGTSTPWKPASHSAQTGLPPSA